jgi:alpha-beta hydrolase superfamily lysophospholipase
MYESELQRFVMRDGATLQGHRFVSSSSDSLVMLHGACGFDNQLNKCSGMLREATGIEIFTYDHRGHGASPGPRGDLTYIGQYASDVADVLRAVRALKPEGRIILGGHSMGGGSMSTMEYIDDDRAGEIAGTPAYMAAVPIRFRALDHHHFQPGILWGSGVGSWNSGFLARSHSQRMR